MDTARKIKKILMTKKIALICVIFIIIGTLIWLGGVFEYWFFGNESINRSNYKMLLGLGFVIISAIVFAGQMLFRRNIMLSKLLKMYMEIRRMVKTMKRNSGKEETPDDSH